MIKLLGTISLLLVLAPMPALSAGDINDAMRSMREGNFAEAYCVLRPYAEAGDPEAQYNIGWMYLNGYGLAMNDRTALKWWERASDQGYTDATFSIAMLYSLGEGKVEKNMDLAIRYYLTAMIDGHEDANAIIRAMLSRNDKSIRAKSPEIIKTYGNLLGPIYEIKVPRANVRKGPTTNDKIITVLETGAKMVELSEKGKWMQVGILDTGEIAWVFKTLIQPHKNTATRSDG